MALDLNHADNADAKAALIERLAQLGPDTVRSMMAAGAFPTTSNAVIYDWLAGPKPAPAPEKPRTSGADAASTSRTTLHSPLSDRNLV